MCSCEEYEFVYWFYIFMLKNCQSQEKNLRKKKQKRVKKKSIFHDGINLLSFNFLLLQFSGLRRRK